MFARIRDWFFNLTAVFIALVVLSSFLIASYELKAWPFGGQRPLREQYQLQRVSRTSLEPFLSAPGRVESARRTVVRCELERISSTGTSSSGGATGGSSTIIWLIPEATTVKKGDVLARLDASTYDEMLRQQAILVEQAKASHLQAQLDVEIARIALREYLEGLVKETTEEMEASITLAKSNLTQASERLEWTKRMNQKGYASVAQLVTDKQNVLTLGLTLQRQVASYDLFQRFTLPKTRMTLEADITTAQTTLDSEQVKMNRQVERFELLKRQVDRCTIRAPHDGVVYYYVDSNPRFGSENTQIEEGMSVRQEQKLFYLPDLTDMEVLVVLNESVVDRVSPGLRASVEFEAVHQLRLGGHVVSIGQIPNQLNPRGEDIRYFFGTVKLDRSGQGLKPGMTAVVTFIMPGREDVLAVPYEAVVSEQGKDACLVAVGDHLERREVKVGKATPDLIEITQGLTEGDLIVLDPPGRATRPRSLAGFETHPWPDGVGSRAAGPKTAGPRPKAPLNGDGERRKGTRPPGGASRKSRKAAPEAE
jgi:HlyD family secretion protein